MIKALLDAKKQIHESAAEFDSKASVKTTKTNIGASIQAGVVSAETFVDRLGLFKVRRLNLISHLPDSSILTCYYSYSS